MADTKISGLTELAEVPAATDEFVVVDKSDTTMAASGTDKRVQFSRVSAEYAYSTYKTLTGPRWGAIVGGSAAGTHMFYVAGTLLLAGVNSGACAMYMDPADYAAGSRTTKLRLRAGVATNAVDPGTLSFTFHFYPVATWGGASGAHPTVATLGASLANVAVTDPAASSRYNDVTADFNFPAAGYYVMAVVTSASVAANAHLDVRCELQMRQV